MGPLSYSTHPRTNRAIDQTRLCFALQEHLSNTSQNRYKKMPTHYDGTETERLALDVYIKLVRASEAVEVRVNRHLADYGLTLSQFGVLESIYHLGPLVQKDIAKKVLKSTGNITLVINNLEKRGLVVRERGLDDRRYIEVSLTDKGRDLIRSMMETHVAGIVEDISILSVDEQLCLARLCRKLGLREVEPVGAD